MRSRLQVKVHINRALRSGTVEQKLDEIALAIAELARYVEDIEKEKLNRSSTALTAQHAAEGRRRSLAL